MNVGLFLSYKTKEDITFNPSRTVFKINKKRSTTATVKVYVAEMVIITFGVWITLKNS